MTWYASGTDTTMRAGESRGAEAMHAWKLISTDGNSAPTVYVSVLQVGK
jgi:hypothetical protein